MREKLILTAMKYVGYLEKKSGNMLESFTANAGYNNYTQFAVTYKMLTQENYQGQPWCAMFVSSVFAECFGEEKGKKLLNGYFAYCPTGVKNFKNTGRFSKSNPEKGDIIFFKDNSGVACHVGIVYNVDITYVYTIEGNTSSSAGVVANGGAVAKKKYLKSYNKILGYGKPKYESEEKKMKELTTVNDIVWELANRKIITDKSLWLKKLEADKNAYWLAKKTIDYLTKKGV